MDNQNNPWGYAPPPGYPVPQPVPPPQPTGLLAPPKGKSRGFALFLLAAMALAQLAASLMPYLDGSSLVYDLLRDNPLSIALDALNLLLALLVLLKFLLPGWEPHRKTLAWLLGFNLLGMLGTTIFGALLGFNLGESMAGGMDSVIMGAVRVGTIIGVVIGMLARPQFILLIGIWSKKSTEKIAGLLSAASMGLGLLGMLVSGLAMRVAELGAEQLSLTSTVPALAASLCWAIFCFVWPVLDRPVLAEKPPAPEEAKAAHFS